MKLLIVFILLVVLLILGVPVPFSFGVATITLATIYNFGPTALMNTSYGKISSVTLLAIPMFILAGGIMEKGKIGTALTSWVELFVGKIKGSLCMVTIITSAIFGAISGSGAATLSCIGSIMAPQQEQRKYPRGVATAVACCAAPLGLLIPPSATQILIAWTVNISVLNCFLSTVIPGIILALLLCVGSWLLLRKNNEIIYEEKRTAVEWGKEFGKRTGYAVPALLMPIIILGGIYSGVMTATEAAGIAVIYAIPVAILVYKGMKGKEFFQALKSTSVSTGTIMVMIAIISMLSRILTQLSIPQMISDTLLSISDNKYVILLMMNIFMIFIGMIMDDTSGVLLTAPLLFPVAVQLGISPYQMAAIMGVNLGMGCITPPTAPFIYLASRVYKTPSSEEMKPVFFLLAVAYLPTLILVTFVPQVSLWLPSVLLGTKLY